jgi:hypothetical protein
MVSAFPAAGCRAFQGKKELIYFYLMFKLTTSIINRSPGNAGSNLSALKESFWGFLLVRLRKNKGPLFFFGKRVCLIEEFVSLTVTNNS